MGATALPITALVGFLIGVVLAYLMALQLRQFGAQQVDQQLADEPCHLREMAAGVDHQAAQAVDALQQVQARGRRRRLLGETAHAFEHGALRILADAKGDDLPRNRSATPTGHRCRGAGCIGVDC